LKALSESRASLRLLEREKAVPKQLSLASMFNKVKSTVVTENPKFSQSEGKSSAKKETEDTAKLTSNQH